jgi:site-specific recombinase XerD
MRGSHEGSGRVRGAVAIQKYLGHRSITSTAVYTAVAPNRVREFWRE